MPKPKPAAATTTEDDYSAWNSNQYSGCFKCHAATALGQTALTNNQLANAQQNMQGWAAVGYTPIMAPALAYGSYQAASYLGWQALGGCLGNPVCSRLLLGSGGAAASRIGQTGDIGEYDLKQYGGASQVPYQTTQGLRVMDQVVNGVAYESKVGYTALTVEISAQVAKDVELMHTGQVDAIYWVFTTSPKTVTIGPSGPLQALLSQNGIGILFNP